MTSDESPERPHDCRSRSTGARDSGSRAGESSGSHRRGTEWFSRHEFGGHRIGHTSSPTRGPGSRSRRTRHHCARRATRTAGSRARTWSWTLCGVRDGIGRQGSVRSTQWKGRQDMRVRLASTLVALVGLSVWPATAWGQADWPTYGGNAWNQRWSGPEADQYAQRQPPGSPHGASDRCQPTGVVRDHAHRRRGHDVRDHRLQRGHDRLRSEQQEAGLALRTQARHDAHLLWAQQPRRRGQRRVGIRGYVGRASHRARLARPARSSGTSRWQTPPQGTASPMPH